VVAGTNFSTPDSLYSDLFNFEHKSTTFCKLFVNLVS